MSDEPLSLEVDSLLLALEAISRQCPERVLRLRGELPGVAEAPEPFELLIFRGFSSSLSHPTAFDPDQPALPAEARIAAAELLAGPFNPSKEQVLRGPLPPQQFLDPRLWD